MRRFLQFVRTHQTAIVATLFVAIVGAVVISIQFQNRTDRRLAHIRSRGCPASLAELGAWYKPVPTERNAALICTRAFALPSFPGQTNETAELLRKEWLPPEREPLTPGRLAELRQLLSVAQPALELLHSVPANPEARYPIDFSAGFATLLPHVPNFKPAMRLLEVEMLVRSAEGNTRDAIAAIVAADRVQSTLASEPILISKLVMLACSEIIVRDIEYLLNANRLTRDELGALRAVVQTANVEAGLSMGIASDRAFGLSVFEDPAQMAAIGSGNTAQPNALGRGVLETLRVSGLFAGDRAYYLDQMSNFAYAAEQPLPERWRLGKAFSTGVSPKKYHIISRMLLPAFSRAFTRQADGIARLRLAETALALECYRRDNFEKTPTSLQELKPTHLAQVPADPFDGQPIRFKTADGGYVLYSIGEDQQDNGGTSPLPKRKNAPGNSTTNSGLDICFSVGVKWGAPAERAASE